MSADIRHSLPVVAAFIRAHYRTIGLVLIGCCVVVPLVRSRPDVSEHWRAYNAALITAHTRDRDREHDQRVNAEHDLVMVKREAARARVAYFAARATVNRQVASLPVATITGDTITIQSTPYIVPHPVAIAWVQRDSLIASQSVALAKGDDAVSATVNEVAATDTVKDHAVKEADAATLLANDQQARADANEALAHPSKWQRLKNAIGSVGKVGSVFVLGVATGAVVVSVVVH